MESIKPVGTLELYLRSQGRQPIDLSVDEDGKINDENANQTIMALRETTALAPESEAFLLRVNSTGGNNHAAGRIIKEIESIQARGLKIVGEAGAKVYSAAFVILQACSLRVAKERSCFIVHGPSYYGAFVDSDAALEENCDRIGRIYGELQKQRAAMIKRLAARCGKCTEAQLDVLMKMKNGEMSARTAFMVWGFVDHMV